MSVNIINIHIILHEGIPRGMYVCIFLNAQFDIPYLVLMVLLNA